MDEADYNFLRSDSESDEGNPEHFHDSQSMLNVKEELWVTEQNAIGENGLVEGNLVQTSRDGGSHPDMPTKAHLQQVLREKLPEFMDISKHSDSNYLVDCVACLLLKEKFDESAVVKQLEDIQFIDDSMLDKITRWLVSVSSICSCQQSAVAQEKPVAKKMPRPKSITALARNRYSETNTNRTASSSSSQVKIEEGNTFRIDSRDHSPCPPRNRGYPKPYEILSRDLVKVLRHHRERNDIHLDAEGFAPLHEVLDVVGSFSSRSYSPEDARRVVTASLHSDGAPRLEIREGAHPGPWIRATRYHSVRGLRTRPSVNMKRLSTALCKILRHDAHRDNVMIGPDGFAPLNDVLAALRRFVATKDDIRVVVSGSLHSDGSPRFESEERRSNGTWIRATQKHSMRGICKQARF